MGESNADLPTGFRLEPGNLHAVDGAARTRNIAIWRTRIEVILAPWATSELYSQSFAFEFSSIYKRVRDEDQAEGVGAKSHTKGYQTG